jgi:hypothetical protein
MHWYTRSNTCTSSAARVYLEEGKWAFQKSSHLLLAWCLLVDAACADYLLTLSTDTLLKASVTPFWKNIDVMAWLPRLTRWNSVIGGNFDSFDHSCFAPRAKKKLDSRQIKSWAKWRKPSQMKVRDLCTVDGGSTIPDWEQLNLIAPSRRHKNALLILF